MSDSANSDPSDGSDDSLSDTELEARIRVGQLDALVMYLESNKRALLAHIERKIGVDLRKRIDPDDIFQETFRIALEKIRKGQIREPDRLSGFIAALARNLVVGHFRRVAARRSLLQACFSPSQASHRG